MGRERRGTRQCLYFCTVGLIMVMLAACCPPVRMSSMTAAEERSADLQSVQQLLGQDDFEGALQGTQQVLDLSPQDPPGDAALFKLGLIHVHYANPKKDYKKALEFFTRLAEEFPESQHTEDARVWADLLQAMEVKEEQESLSRQQSMQLQRVQHLISQGDFEGALRENQQVLSLSPKRPPGDIALFNMGLIHVHYANPKKDIGKALDFFARLVKEFPGSQRSEEAKIWAGLLDTMEKTKQINIEIEKKKKDLRR
jgi:tetratricopeptide (TPR) repeat protein